MSKKIGTKHHTGILMSDLKKIFNDSDTIPVPKGFLKSLEFLAFKANVSLDSCSKQDHIVESDDVLETEKVQFSID
jgi:hypothetical protein